MFRSSPVAAVIAVSLGSAAVAQPALLATAEAFRVLSEAAFSASDSELEAAAARASTKVAGVRATFPPGAARDVEAQLRALDAARQAHDRAGVALASAELYRILVAPAGRSSKIPPEARLLDYARLRYKADLLARPTRWDDARDAVAFAREHWTSLGPQVTTGALRIRFDKALDELDTAAADRDPVRANKAANDFLDLIHQLDAFFAVA